MTSKIVLIVCLFSLNAFAANDPHYCDSNNKCESYYVAHTFVKTQSLDPRQVALLQNFGISDSIISNGESTYEKWVREHDGEAAAFLAITKGLALLELDLGSRAKISALDMIVRIKKFAGDRVFVELDKMLVDRWQKNGGKFKFYKADGKTENDELKLGSGNPGGSLHDGYDVQGYTSLTRVPRVQINYRYSDGEGDIDLDAYSPWIGGVIPNPKHLSYENSDPRQWYEKLVDKLGNPGFKVRKNARKR